MPDETLAPIQRAALLTLMALGGSATNNDLADAANFRLHGGDKDKLNEMSLVKTDESTRPFRHVLTSKGRMWCEAELTEEPPKRAGSPLVGALYAILRGLGRYRESGATLEEIFKVEGVKPETKAEPRDEGTERLIRKAYHSLVREPNGWVSLANLRDHLRPVPRDQVDGALKHMISLPDVSLIPEADQSALKARDHEAAVRIGGEAKHLLAIEGR